MSSIHIWDYVTVLSAFWSVLILCPVFRKENVRAKMSNFCVKKQKQKTEHFRETHSVKIETEMSTCQSSTSNILNDEVINE